jgi:ABC-2 type transport system ATP-binding protein
VDVELRKDMWRVVEDLKADGVTIVLTTHYIEEAEALADRVGVISDGRILLVENKEQLMHQMGTKELTIHLQQPVDSLPETLANYDLRLSPDNQSVIYSYDTKADRTGITGLLSDLSAAGLLLRDLQTSQSSLEDIFVDLLKD